MRLLIELNKFLSINDLWQKKQLQRTQLEFSLVSQKRKNQVFIQRKKVATVKIVSFTRKKIEDKGNIKGAKLAPFFYSYTKKYNSSLGLVTAT